MGGNVRPLGAMSRNDHLCTTAWLELAIVPASVLVVLASRRERRWLMQFHAIITS